MEEFLVFCNNNPLHLRNFSDAQWFKLRLPMLGMWVQSLVRELRCYMPLGQKIKTWNRSNIVTNSIKTFKKMVTSKKKTKKKSITFAYCFIIFQSAFTFLSVLNLHENNERWWVSLNLLIINIHGPCNGLGSLSTYQIDALILEVVSLKTKSER